MNAIKADLLAQNQELIYDENYIDCAYDKFLRILKLSYDKNCPLIKYNKKQSYKDWPWITKGLQNVCLR